MQPPNYSVAYAKTQSNQVSDFRDFVCSLFPKAFLFDFYSFYQFIDTFHVTSYLKPLCFVMITTMKNFTCDFSDHSFLCYGSKISIKSL